MSSGAAWACALGLALFVSAAKIIHAYVWPSIGNDRRAAIDPVFGTYRPAPHYWSDEEEARIARGRARALARMRGELLPDGELEVDDPRNAEALAAALAATAANEDPYEGATFAALRTPPGGVGTGSVIAGAADSSSRTSSGATAALEHALLLDPGNPADMA